MEYNKLRNKVNKFYAGGKIPKYLVPFGPLKRYDETQMATIMDWGSRLGVWDGQSAMTQAQIDQVVSSARFNAFHPEIANPTQATNAISPEQATIAAPTEPLKSPMMQGLGTVSVDTSNLSLKNGQISGGTITQTDGAGNVTNVHEVGNDSRLPAAESPAAAKASGGLSNAGKGMIAQAAVGAAKAIDDLAMGDKNFGAQSQAVDSAAHGVSGALLSSGNPYAMIAGAALEGANFISKAGGRTVQGFDVNIESSGYGTLGHMESKSYRDWGALIGLGGLFNKGAMQRRLERRNEQARLAMTAAAISDDVKFEQEARMNSVDNVLRNNLIALAGGIDTSLLGS